jgi:hypothetical protein
MTLSTTTAQQPASSPQALAGHRKRAQIHRLQPQGLRLPR